MEADTNSLGNCLPLVSPVVGIGIGIAIAIDRRIFVLEIKAAKPISDTDTASDTDAF